MCAVSAALQKISTPKNKAVTGPKSTRIAERGWNHCSVWPRSWSPQRNNSRKTASETAFTHNKGVGIAAVLYRTSIAPHKQTGREKQDIESITYRYILQGRTVYANYIDSITRMIKDKSNPDQLCLSSRNSLQSKGGPLIKASAMESIVRPAILFP